MSAFSWRSLAGLYSARRLYTDARLLWLGLAEYNPAKERHEKALIIRKKIFGEDHAYVAKSYHKLASVYNPRGEFSQAKEIHEKALMIRRKIFGADHVHVATSLHKLASVYNSLGEYNQAKKLHEN